MNSRDIAILTASMVERWTERRDQIERMMTSLNVERVFLERKLKAANFFVEMAAKEDNGNQVETVTDAPTVERRLIQEQNNV